MSDPIEAIKNKLKECRRLAITSHLRPDGDSICTGLALSMMAEAMGVEASFINKDKTPFPFYRLPDNGRITIGQIPPEGFDMIILLECADVSRSGQEHISGYFKVNIDHHYSNDRYADINWVEPEAPAVGEMVFRFGERLGIPLASQVAGHLYCAIVSDTGSFQFSNTSADAFEACSRLVRCGADPIAVSEFLFNNNSPEKVKLLGLVLSTLRMNKRGNIAVITLFKEHLDNLRLQEVDTEDITTQARSIKDVEIVLFFKEIDARTFRVSIRSKGRAHAAAIAEHFGGGGHIHAAGFTAVGEYKRIIEDIPRTVEKLLTDLPQPQT